MDIDFNNITAEKTILLVENQKPDTVLAKRCIKKFWPNATIIAVQSLGSAYNEYKKNNFDMVFLDLNLPDTFGPETVAEMRRFNTTIPIIVITGMCSDLTISQSMKNGASHVMSKAQIMADDFYKVLEKHTNA